MNKLKSKAFTGSWSLSTDEELCKFVNNNKIKVVSIAANFGAVTLYYEELDALVEANE